MSSGARVELVAFCLGLSSHLALAQPRPVPGTIDGIVTDTNLVALTGATASILASGIQVVTGANGRFRIVDLPAGQYVLVVRHLGFAPTSTVMQVASGDTLRMSFALERVANPLDTVVVAGKRLSPRLTEFEDRRRAGFGHFVTQAEIDKRNSAYTADLLRVMPTVIVISPPRGGHVATNVRGHCIYKIFLDGLPFASTNLDDLPSPKELAGIEVYSGAATIPLQYKTTRGSTCGVILVWTRDGT